MNTNKETLEGIEPNAATLITPDATLTEYGFVRLKVKCECCGEPIADTMARHIAENEFEVFQDGKFVTTLVNFKKWKVKQTIQHSFDEAGELEHKELNWNWERMPERVKAIKRAFPDAIKQSAPGRG